jgi:hypothetical protein
VGYEYSYWWIYIGFIVRIFSALVLATYRNSLLFGPTISVAEIDQLILIDNVIP